jgi:UPF0755 protein
MKRRLSCLVLVLLTGLGLGAWRANTWWHQEIAPISTDQQTRSVLVKVPMGATAQEIGDLLVKTGLIRSALAWSVWSRWLSLQPTAGSFQAGTYALSPAASLPDIAGQIWRGEIATRTFTIPEGWSRQQMAAYFEQEGFFPAATFLEATRQIPRAEYAWLPANLPHLEGFLYPDTYQMPLGAAITPEQIVQQMLDRFEALALPVYQQYRAQGQWSLLQWVTLASIVEKEAVVAQERNLIAGVFTNRLQLGMPLGSDPTVEYGLGIRQTKEQPLTLAQVNTPSPYNTYQNPGLPPTPIASPGLTSLQATSTPQATNYLYFVARYDGTHVFSLTLAEHEAAQARIRDQVDADIQAANKTKQPVAN